MKELITINNNPPALIGNELMNRVNSIIEAPYEIDSKELLQVTEELTITVKLKPLKRMIDKICMNLASVGEPTWYADAKDIAWDNQKRLNTIYQLLNIYNMLEKDVKVIKKNKNNCKDNSDYLFSFLLRIQELLKLEQKFKEIKVKEITDTIEFYQMLEEINNPQLSKGKELLEEGDE